MTAPPQHVKGTALAGSFAGFAPRHATPYHAPSASQGYGPPGKAAMGRRGCGERERERNWLS